LQQHWPLLPLMGGGLAYKKFKTYVHCHSRSLNCWIVRPASRTIAASVLGIDGIIARNDDSQRPLRHENMPTLSIDMEPGFLQRSDRAQMIYAGQLRH
jgi:hypothetical protein